MKVFHKKNGGVSSARNLGLENASGEWFYFADADDFLELDLFETCRKYFEEFDIIRFRSYSINYKDRKSGIISDRVSCCEISDFQKHTVARNLIIPVWSAMIKSDIIIKNNISFSINIRNGEDWLFFFHCIMAANNAIQLQYVGYNYRIGDVDACSTNLSVEKIIESFRACEYIEDTVRENKSFDNFVKLGFVNLLNYSVLRVMDSGKTVREIFHCRTELSKTIHFTGIEAKFCFKYYSKLAAIRIYSFFSDVFIYPEILIYKIKNLLRILKRTLSNA